jgi:methionyl-tRNA formyltransferase
MRYIIATIKPWNISFLKKNRKKLPGSCFFIFEPKKLNLKYLKKINPERVFFIHWSQFIKAEIYNSYQCILFHMTDLPYGRGGSPLQNLILRKKKITKISAIKVDKIYDSGDIYLKRSLRLSGTAHDIFVRSINIIFNMIKILVKKNIKPKKQKKSKIIFKRLSIKDNEINFSALKNIIDIYDKIRMVDAETYPRAYCDLGNFKLTLSNSKVKGSKLLASVVIQKK